jgi:resolvase-like protein
MLIGYARVSTHEQTLNLQQDALRKAGCDRIFTDTASGAKIERIGLDEALNYVRKGDTLVVWRLDRLGRSLPHLITTMTDLEDRDFPDLLGLVPWKRPYQTKLPIGGKAAASGPGNSSRKVGSNGTSLRLWA